MMARIEIVKYETVGELWKRLSTIDSDTPLLRPVTITEGYITDFGQYVAVEEIDIPNKHDGLGADPAKVAASPEYDAFLKTKSEEFHSKLDKAEGEGRR